MFFAKDMVKNRSIITQKIRDFFTQNGFLEVETPIMTPIPGMEPYLIPFETSLTPPQIHLYLNTSPELQMKKLLRQADFDKIFNITKVFRNGEMNSPLHNPEFTMLEWYRKNADYTDLMTDCENLILELVKFNRSKSPVNGKSQSICHVSQPSIISTKSNQNFTPGTCSDRSIGGQAKNKLDFSQPYTNENTPFHRLPRKPAQSVNLQTIDLTPPWPRFTTRELFQKYCDMDLMENQTFEKFKKTVDQLAANKAIKTAPSLHPFRFDSAGCSTWDDLYFKIFLNHIEPALAQLKTPIFIYDYPATQAALAKTCTENPFFAERFELYISGIELANAFSELINSKEQRARLIEEQELRKSLGKTVFPIDEEFLQALDRIKVPTAGIALGLDRLIMLLLDKKSIEEVLLFPMNQL